MNPARERMMSEMGLSEMEIEAGNLAIALHFMATGLNPKQLDTAKQKAEWSKALTEAQSDMIKDVRGLLMNFANEIIIEMGEMILNSATESQNEPTH